MIPGVSREDGNLQLTNWPRGASLVFWAFVPSSKDQDPDHGEYGEGSQGYPTDMAVAVARMPDSSRASGDSSNPEDIEDLPGLSDAQHTTSIHAELLRNLTSNNGVNTMAVEEIGSIVEESQPQTVLPTYVPAAAPIDSQQQLEQPAELVRNVSEGTGSIAVDDIGLIADQAEAKTSATLLTQQPAAVQRNESGESSGASSIAVEDIGSIAEESQPQTVLPTYVSAAAPIDSQQQLEQPAELVRNVSEGTGSIAVDDIGLIADQAEAKTSATLSTQQPAAVQRNESGESSGASSIAAEEIGLIAEEREPQAALPTYGSAAAPIDSQQQLEQPAKLDRNVSEGSSIALDQTEANTAATLPTQQPAAVQRNESGESSGVSSIAVEEIGLIAEEREPLATFPTYGSAAAPIDSQQQLEQPAELVRKVSEGTGSIAVDDIGLIADQTEAKTSATLSTQQPAALQRNVSGESSGVSSIAVEEIGSIAEETEPKGEFRSSMSALAQTAPRKLSDSSGDSSDAAAELSALAITPRQPPAGSAETWLRNGRGCTGKICCSFWFMWLVISKPFYMFFVCKIVQTSSTNEMGWLYQMMRISFVRLPPTGQLLVFVYLYSSLAELMNVVMYK